MQKSIFEQMKMTLKENEQICVRKSETNQQVYIFLKTDNEQQTLSALTELERVLHEMEQNILKNRKLYMERLETDRWDLGKKILSELEADVHYFIKADRFNEQKEVSEYQKEQKGVIIS